MVGLNKVGGQIVTILSLQECLTTKNKFDLEELAHRLQFFNKIIMNARNAQVETLYLLDNLIIISISLAELESPEINTKIRLRIIEHIRSNLIQLEEHKSVVSKKLFTKVISHWQAYLSEKEGLMRRVLAGAYSTGSALPEGSLLFRGRNDIFAIINDVYINDTLKETLLLIGQQRMGKSSVIMQIPHKIADVTMFFLDCQKLFADELHAQNNNQALFAAALSQEIALQARDKYGISEILPLSLRSIEEYPLHFLTEWLNNVKSKLNTNRIMLCIDEINWLVQLVSEGKFKVNLLQYLRSLSQDSKWMMLYSGQYELDLWGGDYSVHFKNTRRLHVTYLEESYAKNLLIEPIKESPLIWDEDAVNLVLYWSNRQPYLLQCIGVVIVNRVLSLKQNFSVKPQDAKMAIAKVLDTGRYYFESIASVFDAKTHQILDQIATNKMSNEHIDVLIQLEAQEYICKHVENEWRFVIPLMELWWKKKLNPPIDIYKVIENWSYD